jgi:hypothetical protein
MESHAINDVEEQSPGHAETATKDLFFEEWPLNKVIVHQLLVPNYPIAW